MPPDWTSACTAPAHDAQRPLPGVFTLDRAFDGKTATRPDGILYITTGAGGKELDGPTLTMAQVGETGKEIDRLTVTKAAKA